MTTFIIIVLKVILIPLLSPLCVGVVRKVKASMQNRRGASIFQPYYDLWKLFHKDEVIARDASWIFYLTPFILFGLSLILPLGIPLVGSVESLSFFGDFLVIIYTLAAMTFFLALSGLDVGSAFGGFGSSREMTLAALTEGVLLFSLLPSAIIAHSSNLILMATSASTLSLIDFLPIGIAFMGYFIALMAETGRIPFDNPATHLELTMIHEAMILEYSGKRLALIEWANANKFIFFIILGVNLFFPWGLTTSTAPSALLFALGTVIVKALILIVGIAIVESSVAKLRLFRLPDLLFTGFIFCVISLLIMNI
ncbi:MAG: NADH-quinone oxidoreductase subunit H [Candidatus Levybacteria bacterium]|nr:NADH-quinone oxidoreductase subunit H [Candidatus Levybacteria bacterium]